MHRSKRRTGRAERSYAQRLQRTDGIVSHRLPLEEARKGYELFDTKQATKVLLEP